MTKNQVVPILFMVRWKSIRWSKFLGQRTCLPRSRIPSARRSGGTPRAWTEPGASLDGGWKSSMLGCPMTAQSVHKNHEWKEMEAGQLNHHPLGPGKSTWRCPTDGTVDRSRPIVVP